MNKPRSITIDTVNSQIYVADFSNNRIIKSDLNGANVQLVRGGTASVGTPRGIAVDPFAGEVYWNSSSLNQIRSISLSGAGSVAAEHTFATGRNPVGLALDHSTSTLYAASRGSSPGIDSKIIDGSSQALFTSGLGSSISGTSIDPINGVM